MMDYLKNEENLPQEILEGIRQRLEGLSLKEIPQALQRMAREFTEHNEGGSDLPKFDVEEIF
jgi:hypothetical protein